MSILEVDLSELLRLLVASLRDTINDSTELDPSIRLLLNRLKFLVLESWDFRTDFKSSDLFAFELVLTSH